jgi:CheY-like chemotaxis protein/predicted  nucleic acid-binding Zn-ribbon protein
MVAGDYSVLLVIGNVNDAKIIKKYFQIYGNAITLDYAPDADACYRKLIERVYDLMIIDYALPDSTSVEMVRELRKIDVSAPILIVVGEGEEEQAVEAVEAGADDYAVKTSKGLRDLPSRVEEHIEEYHKRFLTDDKLRERRFELYRNKHVYGLLSTLKSRDLRHIAPITHITHGYNTDLIPGVSSGDRMQKLLNILNHYRVLYRTKIGMSMACPRCGSDDVAPVFNCPNCGSEVFQKMRRRYVCEGICGESFTALERVYSCNRCRERFQEKDLLFDPVYIYSVNADLEPEIAKSIESIRETIKRHTITEHEIKPLINR